MSKDSTYYKEIIQKLTRLRKKEYSFFASVGLQSSLLIGLILFLCFSLLELAGNFSPSVRTYFFFFMLIVFLSALILLFLVPVLKLSGIIGEPDHYSVAKRVGRNFPSPALTRSKRLPITTLLPLRPIWLRRLENRHALYITVSPRRMSSTRPMPCCSATRAT